MAYENLYIPIMYNIIQNMDNTQKIINYLGKHKEEAFTMHELSKLTKIPYATFHRVIQSLQGILTTSKIGKSITLSLNYHNQVLKSHLAISSFEEKKDYLKFHPIINSIAQELNKDEIVVLFGSYAKGLERESSDMDLLIINKSGKKTINFTKYETLFKKSINPIFVTEKEFVLMLNEPQENVGKQALKHHILLNNPESFWRLVIS